MKFIKINCTCMGRFDTSGTSKNDNSPKLLVGHGVKKYGIKIFLRGLQAEIWLFVYILWQFKKSTFFTPWPTKTFGKLSFFEVPEVSNRPMHVQLNCFFFFLVTRNSMLFNSFIYYDELVHDLLEAVSAKPLKRQIFEIHDETLCINRLNHILAK